MEKNYVRQEQQRKKLKDHPYINSIRRIRNEKRVIAGSVETNSHQVTSVVIRSQTYMKMKDNQALP
jgi:hypothetical protein